MKRLIPLLVCATAIMSCKPAWNTDKYVDWLYSSMPLPDSLGHSREWFSTNVAKTLEVRKTMGWNIPEQEFLHFVLPVRVNNEALDDFRTTYSDTLCRRVKGLSMADAALEINHWCHEQATYRPSDARTSPPMSTIHNGVGRCGEESVLAVAALRAAGIPARQVYTPRWAHTDDNHAWVEVWVDGKWWFMGACEPEAKLNMAWFNAPVSRAMLLHTLAYGDYNGPEDVIRRTPCFTEINVIRGYVPARRNTVTILDTDGRPVQGARVEFKIYNYAEFYTVATYNTDEAGRASLDTGYGQIFIWASKDGKFGFGTVGEGGRNCGEGDVSGSVTLCHSYGEEFSAEVNVTPPAENPIPSSASEEELKRNSARLAEEDAIRAAHNHSNHDLEAFRSARVRGGEELLSQLTEKDHCDVCADVLWDAIENSGSLDPYILNPRVDIEPLLPYRSEILQGLEGQEFDSPTSVIRWVNDNIRIVDGRNPQNLRTAPVNVWRARMADSRGRDIFFVALCRTLGFPARLNEVTGITQYRDGNQWVDVNFDASEARTPGVTSSEAGSNAEATETISPKGKLAIEYDKTGAIVRTPLYYRHFTIEKLQDATDGSISPKLMEFGADSDETPVSCFTKGVSLDSGYYMLTSGTRLADGGVMARLDFFNLPADRKTSVPLRLREDSNALAVIGTMDAERCFTNREGLQQSILSATGRGWFLLAVMGDNDEPTSHARIELQSIAADINDWGRPALILAGSEASVNKCQEQLNGIDNAIYGLDGTEGNTSGAVRKMLGDGCERPDATLPIITVCDSFGKIVYFSQGYNTSISSDLRRVFSGL